MPFKIQKHIVVSCGHAFSAASVTSITTNAQFVIGPMFHYSNHKNVVQRQLINTTKEQIESLKIDIFYWKMENHIVIWQVNQTN
jgi:hypothetical protein